MGFFQLPNDELIQKAKSCNSCSCWTEVCNAECCRQMKHPTKRLIKTRLGWKIHSRLNDDLKMYFKLHGCYILGEYLILPKSVGYRVEVSGDFTIFHRDCNNLVDCKCKEYASGNRPDLCKDLDECTGKSSFSTVYLTPNCLANFKGDNQ